MNKAALSKRGACGQLVSDAVMFPAADPGTARYNEQAAAAKRVCEPCPVTRECLNLALTRKYEFGVYGGTTPAERAGMRVRP